MESIRLFTVVALIGLSCGCAMFAGDGNDEECLRQLLATWEAALKAEDIDAVMAVYSEDYRGEGDSDKAFAREFLTSVKAQGALATVEIDTTKAEIVVDDRTAKVGPIEISTREGPRIFYLTLQKEDDGAWRITSSEAR